MNLASEEEHSHESASTLLLRLDPFLWDLNAANRLSVPLHFYSFFKNRIPMNNNILK